MVFEFGSYKADIDVEKRGTFTRMQNPSVKGARAMAAQILRKPSQCFHNQ